MARSQLDKLQAAHDAAEKELEAASNAFAAAEQARADVECDLADAQETLDAIEGRAPHARERLMNSPDFAELDPNELSTKLRELFRSLHVKTAAAKQTAARLETAKAAERVAYTALQTHRHKEVVRAALAMEIQLHDLLNQERAIRMEVTDREGGVHSSSLPYFARYGYDPAITQARLSDARAAGYVDSSETTFTL